MKGRGIWTKFCNNNEKYYRALGYHDRSHCNNEAIRCVKEEQMYCIDMAFLWLNTPEGGEFWAKQSRDLIGLREK